MVKIHKNGTCLYWNRMGQNAAFVNTVNLTWSSYLGDKPPDISIKDYLTYTTRSGKPTLTGGWQQSMYGGGSGDMDLIKRRKGGGGWHGLKKKKGRWHWHSALPTFWLQTCCKQLPQFFCLMISSAWWTSMGPNKPFLPYVVFDKNFVTAKVTSTVVNDNLGWHGHFWIEF